MYEISTNVRKPTIMMAAHNSSGSPTLPCIESNQEEVVDEVQDSKPVLAATMANIPNTS